MKYAKISAIVLTMSLMSGCGTLQGVIKSTDGCEWVRPIFMSEPSIKALRDAQALAPEVRRDREAIAGHNVNVERYCDEKPAQVVIPQRPEE